MALARRLARHPSDPRLKLFVVWQTLRFRRERASLFREGSYLPLSASGDRAEHLCAYAWQGSEEGAARRQYAIVVVPRLLARMGHALSRRAGGSFLPLGPAVWQETRIELPTSAPRTLVNVFTGQSCHADTNGLRAEEVFADFPVALLMEEH